MARPGPPARAPLRLLCALLALPWALPSGMPGGRMPRVVSDPQVQEAAAFAVVTYNARSASDRYFKQLRVTEAQSQIVAGVKYYLTVELAKTTCEKSTGTLKKYQEIQDCDLPPGDLQEKLACHFQVWSRPWLKAMELTKMRCG